MSWYNEETENNFIDATQEFTGGGVASSVSEVTNTEDVNIPVDTPDTGITTTIGNVLLPAVLNDQTGTYDLYIRNINQGGRIFLTTKGTSEKVKIENGLLYVYYDYDFFNAPTIPGGWTDIVNYLVATRQLVYTNQAGILTAEASAYSANANATTANANALSAQTLALQAEGSAASALTTAGTALAQAQQNTGRIFSLESRAAFDAPLTPASNPSTTSLTNNPIRDQAFEFGQNSANAITQGRIAAQTAQRTQQLLTRGQIFFNIATAIIGGGLLGSAISLLGLLLDYTRKQQLDSDLIELLRDLEQNAQNYNNVTLNHLHKNGLQIVSSTNGNFLSAGLYSIEITDETFLNIEISGLPLTAKIDSVSGGKTALAVNDIISIPKADLGGSVTGIGDLEITITSLITEFAAYEIFLQDKINEAKNIENRQRRRQNIPTSSSFSSDGFSITNTQITETLTSEVTNEPTISLKVDTSQFQYDGSGNLQIQSSILAPQTDPNQFTNDPNTGNLQIINYDNLTDLLDHIDTTNNNLVLGNETDWQGYKYDLITIALKGIRAGVFESSFYNNDWLGYFPVLTRLSDDTNIEVVKDVSVQLLDDGNIIGFKKGLIYFKNIDQLKDYDLDRKFEFVCFVKPYNLQNGVEYTLLQTGVGLAENQHDIDNYKLKVAIRDNKLELTHTIKKTTSLGYNTNSYNNWTDYAVGNTIQTQVVNGNQGETYVIQNGITHTWGFRHAENAIASGIIPYKNKIFQRDITTFTTSGSAWLGNEEYFDMYFYNDYQATTPSIWKPSTIYYTENQTSLLGNNISKIIIQYKFFIHPDESADTYVEEIEYQGANNIYDQVEFFLLVNFRKYNDPVIYDSRYYAFDQDAYKSGCDFYEQEIILPTPTPDIGTDYTYLEITLTHRRRSFSNLPVGAPSGFTYYYKQHFLRVVSINFYEYTGSATTTSDWILNTFTTTTDVFPQSYDFNKWYKFVLNTNLANKQLTYYVDDVENIYTFPTTLNIGGNTIEYVFANYSYNGLVRNNDIIIIGNEPSAGQMYFSHFIWNHFQDPNDNYMTLQERNKLDNLINYKYYYENVKVNRYLNTKEFYADVLDARKILVNGNFAFYDLTPAEQLLSLRSDAQTADDLSVGNMYVNIDKLFVTDPVAVGNGFLQFDSGTRTFSIGSSSVSPSDVENAVGNLIQITPSTYGLIFDTTNPNNKYIKLDDLYVNNLINLVIQNELLLSVGFLDATYGDILIQIKDASANSPYDLRELDDTNVRYNYVINGNHQYLYRELNQEIQYDPLLGVGFGPQYPVVMYHFQGEIINNARDWIQGIPASDYDFEQTYPAGQVVYGSGPLNKKNFNGVEGGSTELRTKNTFDLTGAGRSCISFFHKPFGGNVDITDDHDILQIQDIANNDIITFRIEYSSNVATYKLIFTDQTNIANKVSFTFNNSENEIYFGNENCILLWFDLPNFYWYINGKWHGSIINPGFNPIQAINYVHLFIDLFRFNNRSLMYELKVYPKLLFKTTGTISDQIFNAKRVAEITEMIRIITFNTGGFILKELSGVQETKVRSIETKVRSLSTESRVSVIESKASLPTAGSGVAGYVYNDGISQNYILDTPKDLTAVSTAAVGLDDRKILTFKQIPNGADFDIKILSRSITSTSQANKLIDYSWAGIPPLTRYDDPHPPYEYTFLLSYIESQMQAQGYFFQNETNAVGVADPNTPGYSFQMQVLGGDTIKYSGQDGVWALYRVQNSVFTLIQTFNDGDEFLVDNYKYRLDSLYMRKNNDPNTQIRVFIYAPYLFADKIELGQEYYMNSGLSALHPTEPMRNWNFTSASSRKQYNHIMTDKAGAIRPLFLSAQGDKVNTTNGMPANEDSYFKWSWGINYNQIACLLESGDLLLNGDIYVNCPTNAPFDLKTGILVNQIDNLVSPDRLAISGRPALVEQVYNIELTSWDTTNFIAYFSGSDRINTYTNQVVSQFEFYYDDTIEISVSAAVLADIQSLQYHYVSILTPSYTILFDNANNIVSHKFLKTFGSDPYVDVSFGFNYQTNQMNRISIPINLQDIVDYHNQAFLTTDEYILKYKPHTNTFVWENNSGLGVASAGIVETTIPLGSFAPKTATTQISSRRTLAAEVPIEKVSQITTYQVFNGEVEFNSDVFLEKVNDNIGTYFTIYTNTNKQDPTTLVDNFKDRASIVLDDTTKEWIFKRQPESEDIQTATTKFMHDSTTLLTLKHNQVQANVELKVGTIRFADNTTLASTTYIDNQIIALGNALNQAFSTNLAASVANLQSQITQNATNISTNTSNIATNTSDLTAFKNDISTTNPSYTEFSKSIKLPDGTILSTAPTNGVDGVDGADGADGLGFTGGSYNAATGVVTFTSNDGLGFSTGDLRGADGVDGTNGIDGTNGVDGADGADGLGFTGGSYNATTGVVTFTSNDGLGFATGDLRGADGADGVDGTNGTNGTNGIDGTNGVDGADGADGLGFTGGSYNATTGVVTFTSNDGLGFSTGDLRASYTDADARAACFPLTAANTGLPGTGAINLFDNNLWYNSTDGYNRLYFYNAGATYIRAPNLSSSYVYTQIGTDTVLRCGVNEIISYKNIFIGDGLATTPSLFLNGANGQSVSSQIIFGDSGTTTAGYYKQGMVIFYDSSANYLRFSGDNNSDSITDTPFFINISRVTGNVGIANPAPVYKLDVVGDIYTNTTIRTPKIDFNDGTAMTTAPFTPTFLKVYFLEDLSAIMTQLQEPGAIAPYFNTTNIPINVGNFSVSSSGISVPANGYYHIDYCLLMRSRSDGSDRKNIITSIKVNNADPDGRLQGVGGSYMRFRANNDNCENAQAGNTLLYLETTDVVSLWGYREGSTGDVFITRGGNMQIKRIA